MATYQQQISLKYPVKTRWGSSATCLHSLIQNQLALKLTITELAHDNLNSVPEDINNTIESEDFWHDIELLLLILDQLVAGIALFESDIPHLALFYLWYHEQLESNSM